MFVPRIALGLSLLVSAAGYSSVAEAYCRATTCDPSAGSCPKDHHGCDTAGVPVQWDSSNVQLWVNEAGSALRNLSGADTGSAVEAAASAWTSADCSGGGHPSIRVTTETASGIDVGFDRTGTNRNVILYRDAQWPDGGDVIAKTYLGFREGDGGMLDADLALNAVDYAFTLNPVQADDVDLVAVLTHEIGHVLGLGHSDAPGATMQPETKGFAIPELETLTQDDIDGICSIYPPGAPARTNGADPPEPSKPAGCSIARGREPRALMAMLGAIAIAGLFRRASRKKLQGLHIVDASE